MNGNDCDVATYKPISLNNKSSTDTAILDGAITSPTASAVNPPPPPPLPLSLMSMGGAGQFPKVRIM